jgi:hypothetical protein
MPFLSLSSQSRPLGTTIESWSRLAPAKTHASHLRQALEESESLDYTIASSRQELHAAFRLVYEAYVRSGLMQPNSYRMRVMPYHLLTTTEVFVAKRMGDVISTVSLVRDDRLGLPMEAIYGQEINERRQKRLHLAEVSCLADRRGDICHSLPVILRMMTLMAQAAQARGVDQLLIAVHPKHARFYQRFTAFVPMAGQRTYEAVCGKPAVALVLDLNRAPIDSPEHYRRFFGMPLPPESLRYQPIPQEVRAELRLIARECSPTEKLQRPTEVVAC